MPIEHVTSAVIEWKARQPQYGLYGDYFDGRHQLKFITPDWASKYASQVLQDRVLAIRENLCPAVVTNFTDAISIDSWGTDIDAHAAETMGLSRLLGYLTRESFRTGDAFVLVWPDGSGKPRASFQRARLIVPHVDEINNDVLDRAAKIWRDDSGYGRCSVYYTDAVERWRTNSRIIGTGASASDWSSTDMPEQANAWVPCDDNDGPIVRHNFGAVPVCWVKLDADDPRDHGTSILNDVIPLQDGLNASLAHILVNQEAYSRPFWYLLNFKPDQEPVNPYVAQQFHGAELPNAAANVTGRRFDRAKQSIFTHDGPGPFGQLDPPDLTKLTDVQTAFKIKVCSVVGIPPYLMQAQVGNVPSGAALRTLNERRTSRVRSWQADNEPVLRGLKQLLGMGDSGINWANPMPLDELERWQVEQIKKGLGYSLEDILRDVGEADVEGVLERARQAEAASSTAMAQAFLGGQGAASYGG